jgi:hypothetical protein
MLGSKGDFAAAQCHMRRLLRWLNCGLLVWPLLLLLMLLSLLLLMWLIFASIAVCVAAMLRLLRATICTRVGVRFNVRSHAAIVAAHIKVVTIAVIILILVFIAIAMIQCFVNRRRADHSNRTTRGGRRRNRCDKGANGH